MFDSFFYSYPTESVTVKCRVLAETHPGGAQQWFEHTYSAPTRNKAALFSLNELEVPGEPEWPGSTGGASTYHQLLQLQYPRSYEYSAGWTHQLLRDRLLEGVNVFCYVGHSNPDSFFDGVPVPNDSPIYLSKYQSNLPDPPIELTPSIQQMREDAISYPWPPFNTSGHPSINIAAFFSCRIFGAINNYTYLLYPFYNGYGYFLENQAVMGFTVEVKLHHYSELANKFWLELRSGKSIGVARALMMATSAGQFYNLSDSQILGDDYAKLIRVYSPQPSASLWWRSIPMP